MSSGLGAVWLNSKSRVSNDRNLGEPPHPLTSLVQVGTELELLFRLFTFLKGSAGLCVLICWAPVTDPCHGSLPVATVSLGLFSLASRSRMRFSPTLGGPGAGWLAGHRAERDGSALLSRPHPR